MKVPKMYKSSDRYDAGTDVIYDDDSKLQYAPFVYATNAQSGDGGDEEGEDSVMIVHVKENGALDKNWEEILAVMKTGVVAINDIDLDEEVTQKIVTDAYIDESTNAYTVVAMHPSGVGTLATTHYISETSTGELFED